MTFLDFIMFMLDAILGHTPLTSPLLSLDQTFRLCLLRIRHSDFTFIWVRRSNFVFFELGVQTSLSCGSDVQTSSASHSLSYQIRRSDFVFCISGIQTSPSHGSDIQTSSSSYKAFRLCLHID